MYRKDRTYYRMLHDEELIEFAKTGMHENWKELALALAERLDDTINDNDSDN